MGDQWYSNKELFEQINALRYEMQETRNIIKKYNGLREELGETRKELIKVKDEVEGMKSRNSGKNAVFEAIRNWGGWLFALVTLIILLVNQF